MTVASIIRATGAALAAALMLAGAALPAAATTITRVVSPKGLEAWLVHEPSIPIISLEVAWRRAGGATDPAAKAGLANLVSGLLDEGAGSLDSQAFQGRIEELALALSFHAGRDRFSGSLRTLSKNRDEAFRLFGLALTQPRFDAEPVERVRRQVLSQLNEEQEDPDAIASRALYASAFPNHPYGRPVAGTLKTVAAIQRADLVAFAGRRLARDNIVIGVVGDITPAELGPLLDRTFGALPEKAAPAETADVAPALRKAPIIITRDMPQSVVKFAGLGVKRADADYYAAYVMNYVLGGGGLSSRLTEEVREKRGLAYSVYAYLDPMEHAALESGGVATQNARVAEALKLVRLEIGRMRDKGLTAEELANAKTYLNGSFPLQLNSNAKIANILVGIQLEHLGIDYLDRRAGLIDAVTLADIQRVAQRLLDPDNLLVVVVGQPVGLGG